MVILSERFIIIDEIVKITMVRNRLLYLKTILFLEKRFLNCFVYENVNMKKDDLSRKYLEISKIFVY